MNLKEELQKISISDLRGVCRELGVSCPKNKSGIIKRLLGPLKRNYSWAGPAGPAGTGGTGRIIIRGTGSTGGTSNTEDTTRINERARQIEAQQRINQIAAHQRARMNRPFNVIIDEF